MLLRQGEGESAAKVSGVLNLCRAIVVTINPQKGAEFVGGIVCLADDNSNS